ncbi:MAG: hypothetical protein Alpg2KO_11750 [Alphaproteobacteria bacterium]
MLPVPAPSPKDRVAMTSADAARMIDTEDCSLAVATGDSSSPQNRAILHRILWPLFSVLVVAALLSSAVIYKSLRAHEAEMVAQASQTIDALITQEKRRIDTLSDAFAAGFTGNDWSNISLKQLADTAGNGVAVAVMDYQGRILASYPPADGAREWWGLNTIGTIAMTEPRPRQMGDVVSPAPGEAEFVLLTPLATDRMIPRANEALRWLMVRRQFSEPMLEQFARSSGFTNISADAADASRPNRAGTNLLAADGRAMARISWDAPQIAMTAGVSKDMVLWLVFTLLAASVILMIANLRRALGKVNEACERQQAANQAKSVFLATVSHELRTPLNAILGFSEALKEGRFGVMSMRQRQYLTDIHTSGLHLNDLVEDILDYARIESHALQLTEKPGDLGEVLRETARIMRLEASRKGLTLKTDIPEIMPLMLFDAKAMRQMVLNLTSNSIAFTPSGGTVTLGAYQRDDGQIAVVVEDNGIGMDEKTRSIAMTPFGKAAAVTTGYEGRSGLGLPITRGLTELHGGRMDVDSTPGEGTTVELQFPKSRQYAAPVARAA